MRNRIAIVIIILALVTLACVLTPKATEAPGNNQPQIATQPLQEVEATSDMPEPTRSGTIRPAEPTVDPNEIKPGTYKVGDEIRPGLYLGMAGYSINEVCPWERLKSFSGSPGDIIANDNPMGQFYVQLLESDYGFKTICELRYVERPIKSSAFPPQLEPGTYLVGYDIQPGTYKGEGGPDNLSACYWERTKDVTGEMGSIIANDNATGQFYVEILPTDYAFKTACFLELQ